MTTNLRQAERKIITGVNMNVAGKSKRPKLLYVVNESYFFLSHRRELAVAAVAAGYDVHLAAPEDHVWAPPNFDAVQLENLGIAVHPFRLSRRGQNPGNELRTLLELYRLYRRLSPHIVHHLTIKPNIYGGLVSRWLDIPVVVFGLTGLGQVFTAKGAVARVRRQFVTWLLRSALKHANSLVILQNAWDKSFVEEVGIVRSDKTVLVRGSGVDIEEFEHTSEPIGTPLVLLASRLIWEKGIGVYVEAARILRNEEVDARFVIVGDTQPSNPRSVPEAMLKSWVDEELIEWWGRRSDMAEVISQAHIVCLPTVYGEGVPKILLEAAAVGRAIVASDTPACREVVENGVNGLLVQPGDSVGFARALGALIKEPNTRQKMGREGARVARSSFDVREVVRQTMSLYTQLGDSHRTTNRTCDNFELS